ncbi:MAG: hypothetical protein HN396_08065 [Gemmatimonadales bacterium]|jgi:hypothetical protein|nr:hypothetical protein [Gemmatimonadales bacterium]
MSRKTTGLRWRCLASDVPGVRFPLALMRAGQPVCGKHWPFDILILVALLNQHARDHSDACDATPHWSVEDQRAAAHTVWGKLPKRWKSHAMASVRRLCMVPLPIGPNDDAAPLRCGPSHGSIRADPRVWDEFTTGEAFVFSDNTMPMLAELRSHPAALRAAYWFLSASPIRFRTWYIDTYHRKFLAATPVGPTPSPSACVRTVKDMLDALRDAGVLDHYVTLGPVTSGRAPGLPIALRYKIAWGAGMGIRRRNDTDLVRRYRGVPIDWVYGYLKRLPEPPRTVRCFADPAAHKHGDRNPSMTLDPASNTYQCKGCGAGGTVVEMVDLLERGGPVAVRLPRGRRARADHLVAAYRSSPAYQATCLRDVDVRRLYTWVAERSPLASSTAPGREFLRKRGMANLEACTYGIRHWPGRFAEADRQDFTETFGAEPEDTKAWRTLFSHPSKAGVLIWPWWTRVGDLTSITGVVVRAVQSDAETGGRRYGFLGRHSLYGVDSLPPEGEVYITEGTTDAWTLRRLGKAACAIPGRDAVSVLRDAEAHLSGRRVISCLDHDTDDTEAWQRRTYRMAGLLRGCEVAGVEYLLLPEGRDVSSWVAEDPAGRHAVDQLCTQLPDDSTGVTGGTVVRLADALYQNADCGRRAPHARQASAEDVLAEVEAGCDVLSLVAVEDGREPPVEYMVAGQRRDLTRAVWELRVDDVRTLVADLPPDRLRALVVPDARRLTEVFGYADTRRLPVLSLNVAWRRCQLAGVTTGDGSHAAAPTAASCLSRAGVLARGYRQAGIGDDDILKESSYELFLGTVSQNGFAVDSAALGQHIRDADRRTQTTGGSTSPKPLQELRMLRSYACCGSISARPRMNSGRLGRVTCGKPSLQNLTKGGPARTLLGAPAGHRVVSIDYRTIEPRVAAHYARQEHHFRRGHDFYNAVGASVYGCRAMHVTHGQRGQVKAAVNATINGAGIMKVAELLGVAADTAEQFVDAYPFLRWIGGPGSRVAASGDRVVTLGGRVYQIPGLDNDQIQHGGFYRRRAQTTLIQAGATDIVLDRIVAAYESSGLCPSLLVHDEVVYLVPEDDMDQIVPALIDVLQTPLGGFATPLEVRVKVGPDYGSLTEWRPRPDLPGTARTDAACVAESHVPATTGVLPYAGCTTVDRRAAPWGFSGQWGSRRLGTCTAPTLGGPAAAANIRGAVKRR